MSNKLLLKIIAGLSVNYGLACICLWPAAFAMGQRHLMAGISRTMMVQYSFNNLRPSLSICNSLGMLEIGPLFY